MPFYSYEALNENGKKKVGVINAENEKQAKEQLRLQGLMITKVEENQKVLSKAQLQGESLIHFTSQLSQMLKAGIPLFESLEALKEQNADEHFHPVLLQLCESIQRGSSLAEAMEEFPESFDPVYCSMVRAGESSANLENSLDRLKNMLEKSFRMKRQLLTSMIYPCILMFFSILVLFALITFVVPSIEALLDGRPANGITAFVLSLSHFLQNYWLILLFSIFSFTTFAYFQINSPKGRSFFDSFILKLPFLKQLTVQSAISRFSRTMAGLLQGGVPIIDALKMSRKTLSNQSLEAIFLSAEEQVSHGKLLSDDLKRSKYIPKLFIHMLATGEKSGNLSEMLHHIADIYDSELEKNLIRLSQIAQPLILIIMGILVGTVMLAVILPLTDISSLSSGMRA